jgi:hypothetical protein
MTRSLILAIATIALGFMVSCVPAENETAQSIPEIERNAVVDPILAQRRTINPFLAWNRKAGRTGNRYGLGSGCIDFLSAA